MLKIEDGHSVRRAWDRALATKGKKNRRGGRGGAGKVEGRGEKKDKDKEEEEEEQEEEEEEQEEEEEEHERSTTTTISTKSGPGGNKPKLTLHFSSITHTQHKMPVRNRFYPLRRALLIYYE
ncbi:hypothetical protein PoB_000774000 [Plakobranchus ocellatus]|uniref:Uncharacterized protein n=1 Tax=Plakobranchus ocellatus TaxID=259542 RepID=A0AAV3YFF9_9GAST|nr:hypothetical protein PoB_000774000 [Plakobranchus ocellatus]